MSEGLSRRAFLFGGRFAEDENGATAVEYGILGTLIAVAAIGGMRSIGRENKKNYRCVKRAIKGKKQRRRCKR